MYCSKTHRYDFSSLKGTNFTKKNLYTKCKDAKNEFVYVDFRSINKVFFVGLLLAFMLLEISWFVRCLPKLYVQY